MGNQSARRIPRNDHAYASPEHYNQRRTDPKPSPNTPADAKKYAAAPDSASTEVPVLPTPLHGGNGNAMGAQPYGWMPGYGGTPSFASPQYALVPGQVEAQAFGATPQLPYTMLPPQAYSWATPYLHDPNLAPMAYWHLMTQAQQAQAAASGGTAQDEVKDDPERDEKKSEAA